MNQDHRPLHSIHVCATSVFIAAALACGLPSLAGQELQEGIDSVLTGNARVDKLLKEMTLDEKISMLHGSAESEATSQGQAGYLSGIPRLGIPPLRFADGPPGILTRVPGAAPTCTMGLAATFSEKDAYENGELIAREAKSHGIQVVLEPFINLDRDFKYNRGYNTFGEDPFLTGQIGASEIEGIQSYGIMSQAKHFIGFDSNSSNIYVDQQALHEVYAVPFAAAVQAGVSSIMCSYNKINALYSCGNPSTLDKLLRQELGFKGFVTSDWGATHAADFVNAGLDVEMPGLRPESWADPSFFDNQQPPSSTPAQFKPVGGGPGWQTIPEEPEAEAWHGFKEPTPSTNLKRELQVGHITEETITRATGRVLCEMDKFGYLDQHPSQGITSSEIEENAKVIKRTSEDAAVLLKNVGDALPLKKSDLESIALIGPGALQTVAVGRTSEKAVGLTYREIGPAEALERTAGEGNIHIVTATADDMEGVLVPASALSSGGRAGLQRLDRSGNATGIDAQVDFVKSNGSALPPESTLTWQGNLIVPTHGKYRLYLQVLGCYGKLSVDGKPLVGNGLNWLHGDITQAGQDNIFPTREGLDNLRAELDLEAGEHSVTISVSPDSSNAPTQVRFAWVTPEKRAADYEEAVSAARHARTALVFAWSRDWPVFELPGDQDRLISDIAAANPNTIVVLNVSQPVALPWLEKVKAVLQMWWPGDEGGWATANILLGKVTPAGRLPFSWPRKLTDSAAADPRHPERSAEGIFSEKSEDNLNHSQLVPVSYWGNGGPGKTTTYSEGILIGYRWYDANEIAPLFPFGYGLSFTRFKYSNLRLALSSDGGVDVLFHVQNVGHMGGDEVPQVYLRQPAKMAPGVQFAPRVLAAFTRIRLEANEEKSVALHLSPRSMQYWSVSEERWETASGRRTIEVSSSSRDARLVGAIRIRR